MIDGETSVWGRISPDNPPGGVVWLIVVFCTELTHITLIFFISDTVHVKY